MIDILLFQDLSVLLNTVIEHTDLHMHTKDKRNPKKSENVKCLCLRKMIPAINFLKIKM